MSSFKGSHTYSIDNKGRINLPSRLRKYVSPEANDTFVVTRGFEQCLFVYPHDEWIKVETQLRQLSSYNPSHRHFMRALLEHASECQLDGQARIFVPQELREYAELNSEVRIIGMLEKIEVWNPTKYLEYTRGQSESYEDIAAKVMKQT